MRKFPVQVRQQKDLLILSQQDIVGFLEEMKVIGQPADLHPHIYLPQFRLAALRKLSKIVQIGCIDEREVESLEVEGVELSGLVVQLKRI